MRGLRRKPEKFIQNPVNQPNRRLQGMFIVAAVVAMAACGLGSLKQLLPTANDFRGKDRYEIPASAAAILEQADHFELLSLDPRRQVNGTDGDFHGFKVLGTATISDSETRRKLVSAFKRAVAEEPEAIAHCFNPRHGIRVSKNRERADFVICFECRQVQVSYGEGQREFLINNSAKPLFDSVLQTRGLPLAEK